MTTRSVGHRVLRSLVVGLFFLLPICTFAYTSPGNPSGFVNDFAHVLTESEKGILENKIAAFNASTSNEIAVVTVKSLGGDYIEHYATALFQEWKIGTAKHDNGALLLVAVDDHKMRIEVGYGLEGALTDSISAQIIRDDLTPSFKRGDFYGGITTATDDIIKVTKGEYVVNASNKANNDLFSFDTIFIFIIIGIQALVFISSILARSKSWWAGGVVGGVVGGGLTIFGAFGLALFSGVVVTAIFVILGLLFDYFISKTYKGAVATGTSIPWWAGGGHGGGFGGSSSSSSSFGGFGGGSSGGGGASGSW